MDLVVDDFDEDELERELERELAALGPITDEELKAAHSEIEGDARLPLWDDASWEGNRPVGYNEDASRNAREAAAAAMSHLSSMLTEVDAVHGGEGDQGGGAGNDDDDNDDDNNDDDDAKEAAARAAVFGADSVDEHGGEEVPALWALFKQRQKEKNLRMTALTESIRESQVLVSAAEAMERTVPTEAALQDTGIGEEVEDIGERKRALMKEKEERAAADREREEARRRAREEAARAREEEAQAQRALAEERRLAEEKEALGMRMRADAARAKAEEDAAERLRILEEERKAEIVREEERRKAEEEEVRALEQAKAARAVLKKQEDEKERERARRSTDWHKSQTLRDEEIRIEQERTAAARRRQEEQRAAREAAAKASAYDTLSRAMLRAPLWRRHSDVIRAAAVAGAACRRAVCERAYQPLVGQRRAAKEAEEEAARIGGNGGRSMLVRCDGDAPDPIMGGWVRRRRRAAKESESLRPLSGGGEGEEVADAWAWAPVRASMFIDMAVVRAGAAEWRASLPHSTAGNDGAVAPKQSAVSAAREEWVGGGGMPELDDFLEEHCAAVGSDMSEMVRLELNLEGLTEAPQLSGASSLRSLSLNSNKIGSLPWGDMQGLEELEARENMVTSLSGAPRCLTSLTRLNLDQNKLTGAGLKPLADGGMARLRTLEVQGNSLESADGLGQGCPSLERAMLYRNKLASLEGLGGMQRLTYIDAGRNELVDAAGMPDSRLLEVLILYHNRLEAPPIEARALLKQLWLNNNRIPGAMPPLPFLPSLQVLKLSDNEIVSLPPLRACFNLGTLDISFNRIQTLSSLLSLRPCRYIERIQANDNPCSELPGYRPLLAALLPFIADLDNAPLPPREREELRGLHLASDPLLAPLVLRLAPHHAGPRLTHPSTGALNWRAAERLAAASAWRQNGGRDAWHEHCGWRWETAAQCRSRQIMAQRHKREEHARRRTATSGGGRGYGAVIDELESQSREVIGLLEGHHAAHASGGIGRRDVWRVNAGYAKRAERGRGGAAATIQAVVRARLAQRGAAGLVLAAAAARAAAQRRRDAAREGAMLLQGSLRRYLHRERVRRAIEGLSSGGGLSDDEEELEGLMMGGEDEEFWRKGPGDFDVDLEGGQFEEFDEEDAKAAYLNQQRRQQEPAGVAIGGSFGGVMAGGGETEEEERQVRKDALTARIVELGGIIKRQRQEGCGRAEMQGHVDELLELKVQFEQLNQAQQSNRALPPMPVQSTDKQQKQQQKQQQQEEDAVVSTPRGDDDARSEAASHASPMLSHRGSKPRKVVYAKKEEHDGDVRVTEGARKEDIIADWGFTDDRVAEAMLKKRQMYLKMQQKKAKKDAMLDPEQRLARFRRVASQSSGASATTMTASSSSASSTSRPPPALDHSDAESTSSRPSSNSVPEKTIRSSGPRAGRHIAVARASIGAGLPLAGGPAWATRRPSSSSNSDNVMEFTTGGLNKKLVRAQGGLSSPSHSHRSPGPPGLNPKTAMKVNNFFGSL